ncbi:MAG: triose-phosphate isomerase [Saprospiraceae bacterium]|nr:triose-phosphate isomerase [Saprospiraceae bacterium]
MRKKIAAGNWKMNNTQAEAIQLARQLATTQIPEDTLVILGVPFVYIKDVQSAISGTNIEIAAQNCHQELSGAFTGEISASMLASMDVKYVILGHSERREYFEESNELLAKKTNTALSQGLKVIFCCGEALPVREAGSHVAHVKTQLEEGLFHLSADDLKNVVIAYEPIWAIGTGVTASSDQAQEMHREIRALLSNKYGTDTADQMHILYGGSVKPGNASELFSQLDVDGGLVGGASLKAEDFKAIILA